MTDPTHGEQPAKARPQRRPIPAPQQDSGPVVLNEPGTALKAAQKQQRTMMIGAIAVLVALIGGLLITFGLARGSNEPAGELAAGTQESAAAEGLGAEVFLEPAQSVGSDAFFADTAALVDVQAVLIPVIARPDSTDKDTDAVEAVDGSEPGLYGGTKDNARCNRQKLVEFLEANTDKGAAWAGAQGIDPDEIRLFVDTLTPVVLLRDTRVTNHGFVDGRANPIQSVMQAGTAVLVDEEGLPRVRCACGNPLRKPIPQTTVRYSGQPWTAFDPGAVQVVAAGAPSGQFVLQDLEGGVPFARPSGSIGEQDFQAPPAAVAAIRSQILISGLGDQGLAAPVGGRVILGTAARAGNPAGALNQSGDVTFVDSFTPITDVDEDTLATLFVPGDLAALKGTIAASDTVAAAGSNAPAPTTGSRITQRSSAASPATVATSPPAGASAASPPAATPRPAATSRPAATPRPAATSQPAATATSQPAPTPVPAPAATAVPQPTATTVPIATATVQPTPTSAPRQIVDLSRMGSVSANSTFPGFSASAVIDGNVSTSWFSTGPGAGPGVLTWNGPRTELTDIAFIGNASHSNPEFQSGFGFASVTIEVLDAGSVVYSSSGGGEGWSWSANVVGDTVRLTFTGHQDPQCGGFGELIIKGVG